MSTSFQVFGDRVEAFNDLDLIALVYLASRRVASEPDRYLAFAPMLADWILGIAVSGPGTIDLNLNNLIAPDTTRCELIALLTRIGEELSQFGDSVPASVLNKQQVAPNVKFHDYPVTLLSTALRALKSLLGAESNRDSQNRGIGAD